MLAPRSSILDSGGAFRAKNDSFISQEKRNKGIFGAMNQGTETIDKNSWLLFLGSDDMLIDILTVGLYDLFL